MRLTNEQKRLLFHDGYVILKNVVPQNLIDAARDRITSAKPGENLIKSNAFTNLVNSSPVSATLRETMGEFDPPSRVHVAVNKQSPPGNHFTALGYREKDLPYFGHGLHAEGLFAGASPQQPMVGTPEEIYHHMIASGPKGDIGRCADVIGTNTGPLFQDPQMTLAVGSFTAFVIIPLNDQTAEGVGQTAVMPGGHHVLEAFYRWQYEESGCIGPEGPGWPRFDCNTPNRAGHVLLPQPVQDKLMELHPQGLESTPDGRYWPRPVQIRMEPGDAVITVFNLPHTATRNEFGTESRKNMIFRIRNKRRQPNKVVTGVSDHPDRGQMGEWLEYEEGNNPWERSKHALTNMWEEWDGMQDIVAEESANLKPIDFAYLEA